LRFGRFLRNTVRTSGVWGGGDVFQTDDVGQGEGGGQQVSF